MKKLLLAAAIVAGSCAFAMTPAGAQGGTGTSTGTGTSSGGQGTSSAPQLQQKGMSSDRMPSKKVRLTKKKKAHR
jgi:hypothetical protein